VAIDDQGRTEPAVTNVVSTIVPPAVDLGISILGPADGVFPGDTFSYRLQATNSGPDAAPGVVVSNLFPANVSLLGLSPSNSVERMGGFILFSAGTLTNQGSATATISVLATNSTSTNLISANISAPVVTDTNTANDSYTINVPILMPDTNQILATVFPTQALNPMTGWMEQHVLLENITTSGVESVRLLVDGLTNKLVNAVGTNDAIPYVEYGAALAGGGQLELILEYANPSRTSGGDPTLTAYGIPQKNLTPEEGTGITVSRLVSVNFTNAPDLNNGRILLEWPATNGATYQVIYDSQVNFSNANGSQPLVTTPAGANRVQWLDYGPPRTLSSPADAGVRFYKVIEVP